MPDMPFVTHDVAFLDSPIRASVARVTLQPWYEPDPSRCPAWAARFPPLAAAMRDTCALVASEVPGYTHGFLIHGVQHWSDKPATTPSLSTLQQYATRWARVKLVVMPPPITDNGQRNVLVVMTLDTGGVPKWVWHHLAGALISPAKTVGDPPAPVGAATTTTQNPQTPGVTEKQSDMLRRSTRSGH